MFFESNFLRNFQFYLKFPKNFRAASIENKNTHPADRILTVLIFRIESKTGIGPYRRLHHLEGNGLRENINNNPNHNPSHKPNLRFGTTTIRNILRWIWQDNDNKSFSNPLGVSVYRVPRGAVINDPRNYRTNRAELHNEVLFNPSKAVRVAWIPVKEFTYNLGKDCPSCYLKVNRERQLIIKE